jgi:uncharacterized membrane protein
MMARIGGPALWAGVILGIGIVSALDEIVFHQLLQWHHFYVHTTPFRQIVSDGLLHLMSLTLLVVGAILWQGRRQTAAIVTDRPFWAGVLFGMGGFQLLDGVVIHKVLRWHQIREGIPVPDLLPYDLAWIGGAVLLLVAGWLVWRGGPRGQEIR